MNKEFIIREAMVSDAARLTEISSNDHGEYACGPGSYSRELRI